MKNQSTLVSAQAYRKINNEKYLIFALLIATTFAFLPAINAFAVDNSIDLHEEDLVTPTILGLLAAAQADLEAGYLTEPEGDNALEKVKAILVEDPDHLGAARILSDIFKKHTQSLQDALNNKDYPAARKYLTEIRKINPDAIAVSDAEKLLEEQENQKIPVEKGNKEQHDLAGEMIFIPGGTFLMGTLAGRKDEKPQHLVTVPSFEIAKYEVTKGQFKQFIEATGYITDAEKDAGDKEGCFGDGGGVDFGWKIGLSWHKPGYEQTDNHPVVCVSWNDTQAYIAWLNKETGSNYSLSSEAKWEYAVRAGSTTNYHFGDDRSELCKYANLYDEVAQTINKYGWRHANCNDGVAKSAPVGQYLPNSNGLHDMLGNAWEWVGDCWKSGYEDAPSNGEIYKIEGCNLRVTRGGSWYNIPTGVRSANRYWYQPDYRGFNLGFRLFREI